MDLRVRGKIMSIKKSKNVPILYQNKEDCCGCEVCYAICSQEAIAMIKDEEGFYYPVIDSDRCIGCGRCLKVCPIKGIYN